MSNLFFIIYVTIVLLLETVESVWKLENDVEGRHRNRTELDLSKTTHAVKL
jgi:hypothetical protein